MTSQRTDIHRPSAPEFDPQGYDLFGCFDLHPEDGDNLDRIDVVNALLPQGWSFNGNPHGLGQCSHCGARLRYCALMGHTATRTLIYVGATCLDNRFELAKDEFDRLRKAAKLNRERADRDERLADLMSLSPRLADLTYPQVAYAMGDFLGDVGEKMRRDGRLSDKQIEAIDKAFDRWIERAGERAARQAREAELPVCDAPEGKVAIAGEVVHVKVEADYSYSYSGRLTFKMIVRDDRGFKVWSTIPAALLPAEGPAEQLRGQRVEFTATLTRSDRDATFSFGKRPTAARLLVAA